MWINLSYDVGCEYSINLKKRLVGSFPRIMPLLERLNVVAPKLHLKAHKTECHPFFSLDFTPHCGQTDGEGCERIWSGMNQFATSTREMNHGYRHDSLNDHFGDWNFQKFNGIGKLSILLKYVTV